MCGFMLSGIDHSKCSQQTTLHSFSHGSPSSFFFPMDLLIPGIFWERGASVIYGQLGFLGAWETLGSAGNRQLPMFAWKKGEIGVKQGTAAASKGLKPWEKGGVLSICSTSSIPTAWMSFFPPFQPPVFQVIQREMEWN